MPAVAIDDGELVALLLTVTVPVNRPVDCGAKVTVRVPDWPAAIVAPFRPPLALNPLPLTDTAEMVTVELPVFFTLTVCVCFAPIASLPKLKLDDDSERLRVVVPPLPVNGTVSVASDAELLNTNPPLTLPVASGAKNTVKPVVAPGARVLGRLNADELKYGPFTVALEIVR